MRKSVTVALGVIVAAGIVLTAALPYVKMEFAGSAHYTEQDTREYEYYTPELLKNMLRPRRCAAARFIINYRVV